MAVAPVMVLRDAVKTERISKKIREEVWLFSSPPRSFRGQIH